MIVSNGNYQSECHAVFVGSILDVDSVATIKNPRAALS
jgi:hypothetical protein